MPPTDHPRRQTTIVMALSALLLAAIVPVAARAADGDGDGLRDGFERRHGMTAPGRRDTNWDGVVDSAEDSDGDRLSDRAEQRFGTNPARRDSDADGKPDWTEDHDGDGRSNRNEQEQRPLPEQVVPSIEGGQEGPGGRVQAMRDARELGAPPAMPSGRS
jgi:hypothetical protein